MNLHILITRYFTQTFGFLVLNFWTEFRFKKRNLTM